MSSSLILLVIGGIILIYLAYKFIKKLVWLVLSIILIVILMFASVFGLIYYDVKQLSEQTDVTLNLVYGDSQFGSSIMMKNGEVDENSLKSISKNDLKSLKENELDKDEGVYVIYVSEKLFMELIEDEIFDLSEVLNEEAYSEYDLTLDNRDLENIFDSNDALDEILEILFDKNDISGFERTLVEPIVKASLQGALDEMGVGVKEAFFLLAMQQVATDQENILLLVEAYKDDEITIEPSRLTFSLIKWLPSGFILSFFEDSSQG